jgi:hypothetical protein|tara:strand:- start:2701 stop:2898 length:198 start_codon:yes stop_codon:yes gene_type:complete
MPLTIVDVLKQRIEENIDRMTDSLKSGGMQNFEEYKEITGVIQGLTICLREIDDLMQNTEGYEDD